MADWNRNLREEAMNLLEGTRVRLDYYYFIMGGCLVLLSCSCGVVKVVLSVVACGSVSRYRMMFGSVRTLLYQPKKRSWITIEWTSHICQLFLVRQNSSNQTSTERS